MPGTITAAYLVTIGLPVLVLGIALLVVTSIDYFKKAQMKSLQLVLGLILICSVFLLPAILPFGNGL